MFKRKSNKDYPNNDLKEFKEVSSHTKVDNKIQDEISSHYIIRLANCTWLSLGCQCLCKRYDAVSKIYQKGRKRLDEDLSIDKLLVTVRHLKIAVE